ncbi:MAG: hypothetical protein RBT57_03705 [Paludibacter sp.]|jgi:pimeloyl-ACP methyl ester carboxylesterase|nr:hypothetical protein [Paludibacter sp.]
MKTKIILYLLISQFASVMATARFVWLHGLEGEHGLNTWDIYSSMFTNNQGYVFEYTSDKTIGAIAQDLYGKQIKGIDDATGSLVVVGHSMGGLVARSLLPHSPRIKGIITVGAANNGSTLLANTVNGSVYDYFSYAIKKANAAIDASLYSGIFSGAPVTTLAAPLLIPVNVFKTRTMNSTLFALKQLIQNAIGIYKFGHPCVNEMIPGSAYLTALNSTETRVPHLNIFGAEDHWQVIRALGSLSKVDAVKNPVNTDRSYDQEYFPSIQAGLAFIYEIQTKHNLVYNALGVAAVFMPWIWITRELVLNARFNWDEMYRYLETGIHADLAGILGARQYKLQNYCYPIGIDLSKLTCTTAYLPVVTENDGILSRSDVVLPSLANRPVYNIRVAGVNHQEMGNHIAIRRLLDAVINQKTYGNAFGN